MKKLTFIQLKPENEQLCRAFEQLMRMYAKEVDQHQNRTTPAEVITKWISSIIRVQGDKDRHLELCYNDKMLIGFLYGKKDHTEHKGFIKPGYGYIMEFFVLPAHRRKGYGKEMFDRLRDLFKQDGVKRIYLTADPITGKPFWEALGFTATGENSPENDLEIYEKEI